MKKLTPVMVVDRIEPSLEFWTLRLGFETVMTLPEGEALGFAILRRGGVELMYQSRESVRKDLPNLEIGPPGSPNALYIEVEDINDVEDRLQGLELTISRRKTFYGAIEVGVREPGGNLVIFAEQEGSE